MRVIIAKVISRKTSPSEYVRVTLCIVACLAISMPFGFSQTVTKGKDRKKNFGKSLDRFKKADKFQKRNGEPVGKERPSSISDDDVIRVETNMVVTDLLVLNPKGNAIVGLKREDFVVTENGVPQDVELFAKGNDAKIPKTIVLIIEVGNLPTSPQMRLDSAKRLVDKLGPDDKMAIVTSNLQLRLDFIDDKKLLTSTLEKLRYEKPALGRYSYASLLAALTEMFDGSETRPIVINQTFGDELIALKPMWVEYKQFCGRGPDNYCERNFAYSDVLESVERSRATIYNIWPGPQFVGLSKEQQIARMLRMSRSGGEWEERLDRWDGRDDLQKRFVERGAVENTKLQTAFLNIADVSGGFTSFLESPGEADGIYDNILTVIENRYVIGYYPKNEIRDGKRRTVNIEVRGHPEYTIAGRKTYFAPGPSQ